MPKTINTHLYLELIVPFYHHITFGICAAGTEKRIFDLLISYMQQQQNTRSKRTIIHSNKSKRKGKKTYSPFVHAMKKKILSISLPHRILHFKYSVTTKSIAIAPVIIDVI